MQYFIVLVIISVCVKCFNIDVRIYSTLLLLPFFFGGGGDPGFFCHFDIDVCIYSTCTFFVCQADFDVDNVQRLEFVHFYGV